MANWRWVGLGLAVAAGLAQGCGDVLEARSCTDVGWTEGLDVRITSDAPMTKGVYRVVVEIPGETFDVDLKLSSSGTTQGGVTVSQHVERNNWQLNASLTGTPRASGDIAIGGLRPNGGGPESATITVEQDGVEIGKLQLDAIEYQKAEPNGPGCGVATTATATISIAPVQ